MQKLECKVSIAGSAGGRLTAWNIPKTDDATIVHGKLHNVSLEQFDATAFLFCVRFCESRTTSFYGRVQNISIGNAMTSPYRLATQVNDYMFIGRVD